LWPEPEATLAAGGVRCLGSTCRHCGTGATGGNLYPGTLAEGKKSFPWRFPMPQNRGRERPHRLDGDAPTGSERGPGGLSLGRAVVAGAMVGRRPHRRRRLAPRTPRPPPGTSAAVLAPAVPWARWRRRMMCAAAGSRRGCVGRPNLLDQPNHQADKRGGCESYGPFPTVETKKSALGRRECELHIFMPLYVKYQHPHHRRSRALPRVRDFTPRAK
jgi:hypothetical protein